MPSDRHLNKPKLANVIIQKRQDIAKDLFLMWIDKPEGYTFKEGQYCTIGCNGIERAYSIVSAPHEKLLELFVEVVPPPEGVLTLLLEKLDVGDSVTIRPRAKGIFTLKPAKPNQLLVSTVTGVVPYVSYLRSYIHLGNKGHHFFVLQGGSYVDEFAYDGELKLLAEERPDLLTYIPTISRPTEDRNQGWNGETGRVNEIVERYVDKFSLTPQDTLIYACGHPGMIEDVKDRMAQKGFTVEEERFWKDD